MRAGKLRHRIKLQTKSAGTADGYGGQADVWADTYTNIAASVDPLSGRELLAAQAVQNESRFKITTRFIAGFNPITAPAMRIVFGTRVFNIVDATNIEERSRQIEFICSEGLAQG